VGSPIQIKAQTSIREDPNIFNLTANRNSIPST
jgi:hypothetical protein